jgi:hypothetical protein
MWIIETTFSSGKFRAFLSTAQVHPVQIFFYFFIFLFLREPTVIVPSSFDYIYIYIYIYHDRTILSCNSIDLLK